ncbi:hypothetical protein FJR06_08885 [Dolichospermum sp. UHCC 0352]|nr:hypothetical protein [Dolichospermum sp. UHCC 0299]MTJ21433.1 hypothetical protein [Dolichospermum sp. UHCC 0352]MTJ40569.1 hypothetical protein [Dolichospermum sp. UHCC 0406]
MFPNGKSYVLCQQLGCDLKFYNLVIGHWSLVIGHWSMVNGQWSMVNESIYKITIDKLKNFCYDYYS